MPKPMTREVNALPRRACPSTGLPCKQLTGTMGASDGRSGSI